MGINEWEKIKFAIQHNSLALEPDTLRIFNGWLSRANDSYPQFVANITSTYEEMMDRVNGWYKRKIGLFIFWIGFIICMIMNVDSIQIVKTLADNPDKAKEMVTLAISSVEAESKYQSDSTKSDSIKNDTAHLNELKRCYATTISSIAQAQKIMANGWVFPDSVYKKKYRVNQKTKYLISHSSPFGVKFWAIVITALALSLGAQFWFDLLKKLVALRGAGVKPEEKQKDPTITVQSNQGAINDGLAINTQDPLKIVIGKNRGYWESLPGFVAMNEDNDNGKRYIKLIFEKNRSPYETSEFEIDHIKIKCVVGEKGTLTGNSDPIKGAIIQPSTNSWGSPAGIVWNPRTEKYALLTCGHVIRSEHTSFIDLNKAKISISTDSNPREIGVARNMVMSGYCDAGIVDLNIKLEELDRICNMTRINKYRSVSYTEEEVTSVKILSLRGQINGKIIRSGEYYSFNDQGIKDVRYLDLLKIGVTDETQLEPGDTLTKAGDSGSLIVDAKDDMPIGILVGASRSGGHVYSYGIKIKDIFEILQIQKCPTA